MIEQEQVYSALKTYFDYDTFREGQLEIIADVLAGRDVLGILSTGSGKSLCYQLPAKLLPGVTIVVSPLISLMIDQVREVKAFHFKEVVAFHSFQSYQERQQLLAQISTYKLIYISPELLQQHNMLEHLKKLHVSLFVVDEAHCISQWGHDFRPDYLRLKATIVKLNNPPLLALTGTATPEVQREIGEYLGRTNLYKHIYPMDRENISLLVDEVEDDTDKVARMIDLLTTYNVPTIIYFLSRKMSEQVATILTEKLPDRQIAFYHGGVEKEDRLKIQQQFMNDQIQIICSTSAFGMGINKKNIRLIIHYHLPIQLESYIQEIGRAGRDGKPSVSLLLHDASDIERPLHLIENELPTADELRFVFNRLFILHTEKRALPIREAEFSVLMEISITKWRFILYHLELTRIIVDNQLYYHAEDWKRALYSITAFTAARLQIKHNKLQAILNWLTSESCLRKTLYADFQETISSKETQCCSNCGFSFEAWEVTEQTLDQPTVNDWKAKLENILLLGGNG